MPARRLPNRSSDHRTCDQSSDASQDRVRYPIPPRSAQAFRAHQQRQPQNPGLIFDRFAPDWSAQATLKKEGLETVREAAKRTDGALLEGWKLRWNALARAANAEPFVLKTDWRFIAGLGRKGPLEVGFTFHRYGFPILPGSSVKGLARAWALIEIAQKASSSSLKEMDEILAADGPEDSAKRQKYRAWWERQPEEVRRLADDFRTIFGTTAAAGRAIFFDAIPAQVPRLELDVMNPHFPKYYQGTEPPTDWQSPVPVYFLTVAPETEFCFAVGWRGVLDDEGRRLRDLAKKWLLSGLTELGAGAKTSAGYGYFVSPPQMAQPAAPTAPTADSVPSAPPIPPEELIWRTGIVRNYWPDKGVGRLVDVETKEELSFRREAIEEKGWSPGKKHKVRYAVGKQEGRPVVVKIRRM